MRNMLKLLNLKNDNKDVDWLKRLEIMSNESLVQTDYLLFGTTTRWVDDVRNEAANLKEKLENIKADSLKSQDDYKIFFGGTASEIKYSGENSFVMNNFLKIKNPKNIGKFENNPIYKYEDLTKVNKLVKKIIHSDDFRLRKYWGGNDEFYILVTKDGTKSLCKVEKEHYLRFDTDATTFDNLTKFKKNKNVSRLNKLNKLNELNESRLNKSL